MDTAAIWNEFRDELKGFIGKRVSNSDDADDILQDVFEKIHNKLSSLKDESSLISWVYRITRNSIIDYYRSKKPLPEIEADLDEEIYDEKNRQQFHKCLKSHINELPHEYKEAFTKIELEGMSQKDFAAELGISYSGAKSRYQRSKKKLKDLFVECCSVETDKYGNVLSSTIDTCGC